MREFDVIIIGAGQAGLAMGYTLKQLNKSFVIIGKEQRVGDVWRTRYDSLVLFTPRWFSSLPGLPMQGEANGYAAKDEIADYLENYAAHFALPIELGTDVNLLTRTNGAFTLSTSKGDYRSEHVVVATGPFQQPLIPRIAEQLAASITQIHTSQYINPSQLQPGNVLVVGAGNSGAQIAVEIAADREREVTLSIGHPLKFFPLQLLGKNIFWWFDKLGILSANVTGKVGRFLSKQSDPIFGMELRKLLKKGEILLKPRTTTIVDQTASFEDGSRVRIDNIIWATGFVADYGWIQIPDAIDSMGKPNHQRGISPVEGLFFLGRPWQHTRGSALIGGVGKDAEYIAKMINNGCPQSD